MYIIMYNDLLIIMRIYGIHNILCMLCIICYIIILYAIEHNIMK